MKPDASMSGWFAIARMTFGAPPGARPSPRIIGDAERRSRSSGSRSGSVRSTSGMRANLAPPVELVDGSRSSFQDGDRFHLDEQSIHGERGDADQGRGWEGAAVGKELRARLANCSVVRLLVVHDVGVDLDDVRR